MIKSPLKFPGNKHKQLPTLLQLIGAGGSHHLVDPFSGSGVVGLNFDGTCQFNDANEHVYNFFKAVQQYPKELVYKAEPLFEKGNKKTSYDVVRHTYNKLSNSKQELNSFQNTCVLRAALFLYLNKHGFNGLVRFNQKNEWNVPFGDHKSPYFPENEIKLLNAKLVNSTLTNLDFRSLLHNLPRAEGSMVVYCDPPYVPLSETSNFTQYDGSHFTLEDHMGLKIMATRAAKKGYRVIISNNKTEFTKALYKDADELHEVAVSRTIAASGACRKSVIEVVAVYYAK